jgi:hypothetical protein
MLKGISRLLLCAFILNIWGFCILFYAGHAYFRSEAKDIYKESNTDLVLELKKNDNQTWHWINEHEVIVAGKLYDVSNVEDGGEKLIFYCQPDEQEGYFIKMFEEILADCIDDNEDDKHGKSSAKSFSYIAVLNSETISLQILSDPLAFAGQRVSVCSSYIEVAVPPPSYA